MKLVPLVWKDGNIIISDEEKMNGTVQMNSSLKISNFFNQFFFSNILFFFVFFSVSVFFFFFFFFVLPTIAINIACRTPLTRTLTELIHNFFILITGINVDNYKPLTYSLR